MDAHQWHDECMASPQPCPQPLDTRELKALPAGTRRTYAQNVHHQLRRSAIASPIHDPHRTQTLMAWACAGKPGPGNQSTGKGAGATRRGVRCGRRQCWSM